MGLISDLRARGSQPATADAAPSKVATRGTRRWGCGLIVATTASLLVACGGAGQTGPPTLNWYIFHEPSGSFQAAAASCSAAAHGRYDIKLQELPAAADAQRQQLVRRSAAKD